MVQGGFDSRPRHARHSTSDEMKEDTMNARTSFELTVGQDTYEVKYLFVDWNTSYKKTRVFFSGVTSPIADPEWEDFPHLHTQLNEGREYKFEPGYVLHTQRGDFPEIDKAWDRANRAYVDASTHHVERVLRTLFFQGDLSGGNNVLGKVRFSKNAGCSCGCSPGWVMDETTYTSLPQRQVPGSSAFIEDIFITKK